MSNQATDLQTANLLREIFVSSGFSWKQECILSLRRATKHSDVIEV